MPRSLELMVLSSLLGLAAAGLTAQPKDYEVLVVPALESEPALFDQIHGSALTNRGEVFGQACASDAVLPVARCTAFRFHRGLIENVVEIGDSSSQVVASNGKGALVGESGSGLDKQFFRSTRKGAVEILDLGLPRTDSGKLLGGTFIRGFNDRGEVVAEVNNENGAETLIYRDSKIGWEPLTAGEPEFAGGVFFEGFNNHGDSVLRQWDGVSSAAYLYLRDRSIVVIQPTAPGFLLLNRPTELLATSGRTGIEVERAVYYDPVGGLREIHPKGYRDSYALQTLEDGTALVAAKKGRAERIRILFTYRPDTGLEQLWTRSELQDVAEQAGCPKPRKAHVFLFRMNQAGELLFRLACAGFPGSVHFSRETGFTVVKEVLAARGFGDIAADNWDINDQGQLLISTFLENRTATLVLTPVD